MNFEKDKMQYVLNEVMADFKIEGMDLKEDEVDSITRCLNGESDFDQEVSALVKKYRQ